ncbi:MAG: aryl-sulfate sulfotransferase [Actinomycetes bacterium]
MKLARRTIVGVLSISISAFLFAPSGVNAASISVQSVVPGQTVFLAQATLANVDVATLTSIDFVISPKQGSSTVAIRGTYSASYLASHDLLNTQGRNASVPVYGLYQGSSNRISFTVRNRVGQRSTTSATSVNFTTEAWDNGRSYSYTHPTKVVPRNNAVRLNYSFFMLKAWGSNANPVVMDTDGEVRWVGTAGGKMPGATYFENGFYVGEGSEMTRIELDGTTSSVANFSSLGYADFHHNIDKGRTGMLVDLNHYPDVESDIVEVSGSGTVLNTWNLAQIIGDAISANNEDPSSFVRPGNYDDWFHNNAATYWPQKNELVVSSRENFVIGIGYDSKKIEWILGDPTKKWHEFAALRKFALNMTGNGLAPVGQHAVSITPDNKLMLFDNGLASYGQYPGGVNRGYSAPRKYSIDLRTMKATETWHFEHGQSVYSPICSSVYLDGGSYLIDYASENWGQDIRLVGLDQQGRTAFEYTLDGYQWDMGWNALPIHIENNVYK